MNGTGNPRPSHLDAGTKKRPYLTQTRSHGGTMTNGKVESVHIAPTALSPMAAVTVVEAIPGLGLEGDRYAKQGGTFSKPLPDFELT